MHLPIKQRPYSSHAPNWRRAVGRKRCHLAGRSFSQATPFRLYLARVLRGAYLKKREERFPLSFSFIQLISSSSLLLSLHFRSYSLTLARRKPFAISPLPSISILFHDTFMYRMSNIRGNRILSVSLATFPRHSFAMRRLREVNFSYGCLPLSLQLSLSRMEFLRFRRTLCNTLYSRDEQGGGRKGLASIIDVLSLSVSCWYTGLLLWTVFVFRLSIWWSLLARLSSMASLFN